MEIFTRYLTWAKLVLIGDIFTMFVVRFLINGAWRIPSSYGDVIMSNSCLYQLKPTITLRVVFINLKLIVLIAFRFKRHCYLVQPVNHIHTHHYLNTYYEKYPVYMALDTNEICFCRHSPKDSRQNKVECSNCETLIPDWWVVYVMSLNQTWCHFSKLTKRY